MQKGLTIVVPAFNEGDKLKETVQEILSVAAIELDAFEVIIVNDGSGDATAEVADSLASGHRAVTVIHHASNQGVGAAYLAGLERARYAYISLVPGDRPFHKSSIREVFASVGKAELIVTYRANPSARTPLRRLLSICCTRSMRLLTGKPIRDAHSMYVFPVSKARRIRVSPGYGYHIISLSTLLRICDSYLQAPVLLNPKPDASSSVMRVRVVATLIATMGQMFLERLIPWLGRKRLQPEGPLAEPAVPAKRRKAA